MNSIEEWFLIVLHLLYVVLRRVRLCDPMDCSLPDSSVSGIFPIRILMEWVAISFSSRSSQPRDQIRVLHLLHWQADSLPLSHLHWLVKKYIYTYMEHWLVPGIWLNTRDSTGSKTSSGHKEVQCRWMLTKHLILFSHLLAHLLPGRAMRLVLGSGLYVEMMPVPSWAETVKIPYEPFYVSWWLRTLCFQQILIYWFA